MQVAARAASRPASHSTQLLCALATRRELVSRRGHASMACPGARERAASPVHASRGEVILARRRVRRPDLATPLPAPNRTVVIKWQCRRLPLLITEQATTITSESRKELDRKAREGETVVPGGTGGKSLEAQEHLAEGPEQLGQEGYSEMGKKGGLSSNDESGGERAAREGVDIDESKFTTKRARAL
ncbi:hypothetical protein HU200_024840 [Digitaria exilis]|uniref:Uncharacterized protein n=1 Tax=Digitaria exilis TaxID=1010633 RepID=A0A835C0J5_9POAL|nr:hypothetical protein HU200_024840 [Digitaria exilis]